MKFKTRPEARYYIYSHPSKIRKKMHIVPTRVWNRLTESWEEIYVVALENKITPRHSRKKLSKKLAKYIP